MKIIAIWSMITFLSMAVNCQNTDSSSSEVLNDRNTSMSLTPGEGEKILTLAGGCFWCTEEVFERVRGVDRVISGYAGGQTDDPTYESIGTGLTGHAETIQIYYDPQKVSMESLLEVFFFAAHDPTQVNRQGPDIGTQYRSIAFYRTPVEKKTIENYIQELDQSGKFSKSIATEVEPFEKFYPAEEYHQNYYPQHPDNPYIQRISQPKVDKFEKLFPQLSVNSQEN